MRAIATFVAIKANPKFTTQIDANNAAKIIPKTNKQYFAIVRFAKIIKGSFLRKGSISWSIDESPLSACEVIA